MNFYVETLLGTSAGDANLDGVFDSSDLVTVFRSAKYELNDGTATWIEGDWTCDGNFGSGDLVAAFRAGRYVAAAAPHRVGPTDGTIGAALPAHDSPISSWSRVQQTPNETFIEERNRPVRFADSLVPESVFVRSRVIETDKVFADHSDLTDDVNTEEHFT